MDWTTFKYLQKHGTTPQRHVNSSVTLLVSSNATDQPRQTTTLTPEHTHLKMIEDNVVEAKVNNSVESGPSLMEYYPEKHTMWVRRTKRKPSRNTSLNPTSATSNK